MAEMNEKETAVALFNECCRLREIIEEKDKALERAHTILANMAAEEMGWCRIFRRWAISDEPLRNDAKNAVKDIWKAWSKN